MIIQPSYKLKEQFACPSCNTYAEVQIITGACDCGKLQTSQDRGYYDNGQYIQEPLHHTITYQLNKYYWWVDINLKNITAHFDVFVGKRSTKYKRLLALDFIPDLIYYSPDKQQEAIETYITFQ